ncbi:acireductone synthase [Streptomyces swartbergensis]|uniref:Enolase-phosphatase E1 n=1 Tax=Streptomyces swartbergensis TaxID=487165 RepID=A0A243S8G7_9ACTN|nr:acireductone synthase [Streptomyces swartbergensis]OUD03942.1 acireductone synthase [Streptomyces swartbergensis]
MPLTIAADHVVLDIEGTTSATGYVLDVLYPYSRARLGALLTERAADPAVRRATEQVRRLIGEPDAGPARVAAVLLAWLDEDRKAAPLKTLQGILWSEGFAAGDLVSHFYADVPPALRRWHRAGTRLSVYSSGSVAAQRAWFAHSPAGDLLPLLDGCYDIENAGPKQSAASYHVISAALGSAPERTLFLSDRPSELDAARTAGWLTVRVRRPGEPYADRVGGTHPETAAFTDLHVGPPRDTCALDDKHGTPARRGPRPPRVRNTRTDSGR